MNAAMHLSGHIKITGQPKIVWGPYADIFPRNLRQGTFSNFSCHTITRMYKDTTSGVVRYVTDIVCDNFRDVFRDPKP